eukprot:GILJ01011203.1.p1 GENE.GILJ01011203.1~~GILJ01011203.1.p1  ORF type:complete len:854 (-),score=156.85 GILJ01011203.1:145-2706(-)
MSNQSNTEQGSFGQNITQEKESKNGRKTANRDWETWTDEEKSAFFDVILNAKDFPTLNKLFEGITKRVGSKTPAKVRDFYYRLLKRINKVLEPVGHHIDSKAHADAVVALQCYGQLFKRGRRKETDKKDTTAGGGGGGGAGKKMAVVDKFAKLSQHPRYHKTVANALLSLLVSKQAQERKKTLIAKRQQAQLAKKTVKKPSARKTGKAVPSTTEACPSCLKCQNSSTPVSTVTSTVPAGRRLLSNEKLTLRLVPRNTQVQSTVAAAGFNPRLELRVSNRKSIGKIVSHLNSKWVQPNSGTCVAGEHAIRLSPASELKSLSESLKPSSNAGSLMSWGVEDVHINLDQIFEACGSPEDGIFTLSYWWDTSTNQTTATATGQLGSFADAVNRFRIDSTQHTSSSHVRFERNGSIDIQRSTATFEHASPHIQSPGDMLSKPSGYCPDEEHGHLHTGCNDGESSIQAELEFNSTNGEGQLVHSSDSDDEDSDLLDNIFELLANYDGSIGDSTFELRDQDHEVVTHEYVGSDVNRPEIDLDFSISNLFAPTATAAKDNASTAGLGLGSTSTPTQHFEPRHDSYQLIHDLTTRDSSQGSSWERAIDKFCNGYGNGSNGASNVDVSAGGSNFFGESSSHALQQSNSKQNNTSTPLLPTLSNLIGPNSNSAFANMLLADVSRDGFGRSAWTLEDDGTRQPFQQLQQNSLPIHDSTPASSSAPVQPRAELTFAAAIKSSSATVHSVETVSAPVPTAAKSNEVSFLRKRARDKLVGKSQPSSTSDEKAVQARTTKKARSSVPLVPIAPHPTVSPVPSAVPVAAPFGHHQPFGQAPYPMVPLYMPIQPHPSIIRPYSNDFSSGRH